MKYHINPDTHRPNQCKAEYQCRFASDTGVIPPHYDTKEEARAHAEIIVEKVYGDPSIYQRTKKTQKRASTPRKKKKAEEPVESGLSEPKAPVEPASATNAVTLKPKALSEAKEKALRDVVRNSYTKTVSEMIDKIDPHDAVQFLKDTSYKERLFAVDEGLKKEVEIFHSMRKAVEANNSEMAEIERRDSLGDGLDRLRQLRAENNRLRQSMALQLFYSRKFGDGASDEMYNTYKDEIKDRATIASLSNAGGILSEEDRKVAEDAVTEHMKYGDFFNARDAIQHRVIANPSLKSEDKVEGSDYSLRDIDRMADEMHYLKDSNAVDNLPIEDRVAYIKSVDENLKTLVDGLEKAERSKERFMGFSMDGFDYTSKEDRRRSDIAGISLWQENYKYLFVARGLEKSMAEEATAIRTKYAGVKFNNLPKPVKERADYLNTEYRKLRETTQKLERLRDSLSYMPHALKLSDIPPNETESLYI